MILFWALLVIGILLAASDLIYWGIRRECEEKQMCYICRSIKASTFHVVLSPNAKAIVEWYVSHHPDYVGRKENDVVEMLIELGCEAVEKNNPATPLDPEVAKGLTEL